MKDYSMNDEERKSFVLNYTKDDEIITANYADGSSFTIPNTENNENKLESKMIDQVANSKEKRKKVIRSSEITAFLIFLLTAASLNGVYWLGNMAVIKELVLGLGIAVVVNIPMFAKLVKNNSILKDIQKNRFFVKNQEVINRGIVNTNVLVNSNVQGKEIITINDIDDNYKFDELKQIVENTEKQEQFSFDTFSEEEVAQDKPKARVRRR